MQSTPAILFLLSLLWIVYVLFGYPLLLAVLARIQRRPVKKGPAEPSVSFILPVHNGAAFLRSKLQSILHLDYPRELVEVIVLLDGPDEASEVIAREFAGSGVRVISLPRGGKARTLNRGLAEASHELLVFTDVRQTLETGSLRRLAECFADPSVGIVSANLLICSGDRVQESDIGLYRRYEAWIRTRLSRFSSVLGASGCYYAARREPLRPMPDDTLLDDVYLPMCAIMAGYRCILEPTAHCFDYPTALDSEFRRKVRTQAGVYQLLRYFPSLLLPWTAVGFHFLSLKLGRLLMPFAFLILFVSTWGLPEPWRTAALIPQLLFYAFALLDFIVPERSPLKRLTSPVRSFLVLTAAALAAVAIFFVPAQDLWKNTVVNRGARSVQ